MRAVAVLMVLMVSVAIVPETEAFWGLVRGAVESVADYYQHTRRRGLQDIVGLPTEQMDESCKQLGTPAPVDVTIISSLFKHVDGDASIGSVKDNILSHEEVLVFIGALETLDYCYTKSQAP